jgi:hypothetical protein
MPTARELRTASKRELRDAIVNGYPVDPRALEGWTYRGTSLGLPGLVEKLTWKTFQKTFWRDPRTGRLLGWNVRLEQDGIDAPSRPKMRDGRPVTEWNYEVIAAHGVPKPPGFDRGLIIDYARAPNAPGPVMITKDPLVALKPGSADELIGVSYLVIGGRCVETPTYFTLERDHPIADVPGAIVGPAGLDPLRLTSVERRWADAIFAAILPAQTGGLPPFVTPLEGVRGGFWRVFESAPSPLVRAGLRPMIYTLTFLPVIRGFGRPFFALSIEERARFLAAVAEDRTYFVRQALGTLKMLACFAYFEDPAARARFVGAEGGAS